MAESYSVRAVLEAYDSGFTSGMEKAAKATQNLGGSTQTNMKTVGKAVTVAGAATTAMGFNALKSYGSFQQSLNQAAVIAGGTSKDIQGLSDVANKMGEALPINAQQAADAMVAMARDGASIKTIEKEFPAIAKAATAAGADLQTTASVVQQSMNIWGDSLQSPEQAAGILVQVANQSNASIESMQQALADVGPTAKAAGYSMQDTANAIGLLTNTGMSSAQAADNLNHAIVQMQTPTKKAQGYMNDLGISFRDAQGHMKPIPQIAGELNKAFDGVSESERDMAMKAMFGQDGMRVMQTLMKSVADETGNTTTSWNAASKAIEKYAGTTDKANKNLDNQAGEMQKNVKAKLDQVGGSWDTLRNRAMDSQSRVTGAMLDMTSGTLSWAGKSDSAFAKVIRGFIGLTPVIGPAMTAVGGFITNAQKIGGVLSGGVSALKNFGSGTKNLIKTGSSLVSIARGSKDALTALKTLADTSKIARAGLMAYNAVVKVGTAIQAAFNAVAALNPFVLIAAAIVAVIAVLVLFFTKTKLGQQLWQGFVDFLADAWQGLCDIASTVWGFIVDVFNGAVEKVKGVWNSITEFFSNLWNGIVSVASSAWNGFIQAISPIIDAFKNLWSALSEFFSTLWQGIIQLGATIWNGFIAVITPIIEAFKMLWQGLVEFFSVLWQGIVSVATVIWNTLVTIMTPIVEGIKMLWNGFVEFMSMLWQLIVTGASLAWQGLVTVVTIVWETIKNVIQTAVEIVSTVIQTVLTVVQTVWSTIWNAIVTVAQTVWNNIVNIVSSLINAVADIIRAVTEAIKGNWDGAWNAIKDAASTIWNAIKTTVQTTINTINSIINSILNAICSIWSAVWNSVKSITSTVWNGISSTVSSVINGIRSTVSSILNSIVSFFSSGWNRAKSATSKGITGAWNKVKEVSSRMLSAGKDFVMGFVKGITGAIGGAVRAAANMAKNALNAAKSALGINSPSRVMRDEVGYYVPAGLAVGMLGNLGVVEKASDKLAEASMFSVPSVDTHDFTNSIAAMNSNMSNSVTGSLTHELNINQQPAYINLSLGGSDYGAFVEDIGREQGAQASLMRNYKF